MAFFSRYIGIDYSGAATPTTSLKGLRVYVATLESDTQEITPPAGGRKYWSRQGIADWLAKKLTDGIPTVVGIDHGFSFPLAYFEAHSLPLDWPLFLDDFQSHWPTDQADTRVEFIREGRVGKGIHRSGNPRWRRQCEIRCRGKSVFHFDVQGSVAKSTHAGLPWLNFLRTQLGPDLHFWPFDGWSIPSGHSVVLEAYPALYKTLFDEEGRTPDQHDAYSIARWLCESDQDGSLRDALQPALSDEVKALAEIEGWILGVR